MSEPTRESMSDPMRNDPTNPSRDARADDDVLLLQIRAALTPVPEVDRRAIASILAAVAQRQPTRRERLQAWWEDLTGRIGASTTPLARGATLAAAALTIGFVARGVLTDRTTPAASRLADATPARAESLPSSTTRSMPALQQVEGTADRSALRVPVQFVLDARDAADASSVHVVGDFNDWDVSATPMTLERGVWSVSLPITQGRHVYAFVVGGDRWIADPRAPQTKDTDFGRPTSVVIVQVP